jgi:hypothetical protein
MEQVETECPENGTWEDHDPNKIKSWFALGWGDFPSSPPVYELEAFVT